MDALPIQIRAKAIACYQLPSRESYVKKFIQRLALVPQILPVEKGYVGRSRLDHSRNICRVLEKIEFNGVSPHLKQDLMIGALCHDIGHPQHGHSGERAINAYFERENKFLNDLHSLRILYFRPDDAKPNFLPLFSTEPARSLSSLLPKNRLSIRSGGHEAARLLDFMDDLENAVGDIGDLVRNFPKTRVPRTVGSLGLHVPINSEDTWLECFRLVRRAVPSMSFEAIIRILEEGSDFSSLVKELRAEINEARAENRDISAADHEFFEQTTALVGRISDAVFSREGVSETTIEAVIDIAASTIM